MASPLPSGTRLDRYEIISQLGVGGMGEVYLAEDTRLHRRVALKILPSEVASHRDRMRRFLQEATAAASLNHPNIAHIYETGESAATPSVKSGQPHAETPGEHLHFIAMEFVDGITLREKIHREHSELKKLLRYLQQVAEGLAKAHAAGVVHRDLKPDNVMITADGHPKILDFGLAKLIEPPLPANTGDAGSSEVATAVMPQQHSTPGTVLGTVGYMSPEQAQGKISEIDHRSDIFSFGCILFEAITGHKPFEGESALKSLHMVVYEQAPAIKDFNPSAPAELQRIVRRCLAKDPEDRYQSIKDVAIELREVRHEMAEAAGLAAGIDTTVPPSSSAASLSPSSGPHTGATTAAGTKSTQPVTHSTQSSAEYLVSGIKQHRKAAGVALALLLLVGTAVAVGWYKFAGKTKVDPFRSIEFTRMTNGGRVGNAVMDGSTSISPDGNYVVFSLIEAGKVSLWVRQILTNSNVQIVPPAEGGNGGTTISRDGQFVFYRWVDTNDPDGAIYQVPILGGTPRKIISGATSPVSFSPDGQRFAFVRSLTGQKDLLMVANADGSGERILVTRSANDWFNGAGPSWSPDGKTIACAAGTDTGGTHMTVIGVEPDTGATRTLTPHKFSGDVHRVVWMSDGSGLIALAQTEFQSAGNTQLWFIAYPEGVVRRITSDLNSYGRVSLGLASDNATLVTAQSDPSVQIWTAGFNEPTSEAKKISNGRVDGIGGLTWSADGRIIHGTQAGDKSELWIMNADGSDNKQLTSDGYPKDGPTVSPDGKFIFFTSLRSGVPHIWRINTDGSNPKQITSGDFADFTPTCAPDSQWITFVSFRTGAARLWRVGVDGGEATQLTDKPSERALFSPDGTSLACGYLDEGAWKLAIIPIAGGKPSRLIDPPERRGGGFGLDLWSWAPDGRSIIFAASRNGVSNLFSQPIDGGKPTQITNFTTDLIRELAISPDGKHFALSRGHFTLDVVLIRDSKAVNRKW